MSKFVPTYRTCHEISAQCPASATTYGYVPNLGASVFFTAWFGVLLVLSLFLGIRSRAWTYTIALGLGAVLEMLGYIGRDIMNQNVWNQGAFQLQIIGLVLAPSFLAASVYLTLKHLVIFFGPEHSILKPRLYPWLFVGCDIGSIVLQAIGGGVAASAGTKEDRKLLNTGNGLIVAGIAFQVATMTICGLLVLSCLFKYQRAKKNNGGVSSAMEKTEFAQISEDPKKKRNLTLFCTAIALAYLTILIRCIYRLPEMAGGWGNPLMQDELQFLILDGAMIAISTLMLTVFHPSLFFPIMCNPKIAAESGGETATESIS